MNKPNILFFFTDDQRFNTISAINNTQIHTPVMDSLSRNGTAFTNSYIMGGSCDAVCMPSRAMLHTGRGLFQICGKGEQIQPDHTLMGEHFQSCGYSSYGIGKWHNGTSSFNRAFQDGDEIFFGGMDDHWNVPACHYCADGAYPVSQVLFDDGIGTPRLRDAFVDHVTEKKHSTDLFADAAIKYLTNRNEDNPFFMYVSFMAPHDPRTMPQKYKSMYNPEDIKLPENFMTKHPFDNGDLEVRDELLATRPRDPKEIQRHIAEYYAMISHLDDQIGRVLDTLRSTGEYENTIIILAGDNGLALGQHGLMGKQNVYDHSVHVPLIIGGPGIPKKQLCDKYVYLYDLFPTLCDLIGSQIPESITGKSFAHCLKNPDAAARQAMLFAYRNIMRAVQTKDHKLIRYTVKGETIHQLFDKHSDPLELNNIYEDVSEDLILSLTDQLKALQEKAKDPLLEGVPS